MDEMPVVVEARLLEGHTVRLWFKDGTVGDVDLSDVVGRGPVFEPLTDPSFFKKLRVEDGAIAWPNGADIAPESLYDRARANPVSPAAS